MESKRRVFSLLGVNDWPTAVRCYSSQQKAFGTDFSLTLLDDGSLRAEDLLALGESLPGVEIIAAEESARIVSAALAQHPNLLWARNTSNILKKLIDPFILAEESEVRFVDSDVLFIAAVKNLFVFPSQNVSAVFTTDLMNAYMLPRSPRELLSLQIPARCNTGIYLARKNLLDFDFLEQLFERFCGSFAKKHRNNCWMHPWLEQTLLVLSANRAGLVHRWSSEAIPIPINTSNISSNTVALHFVRSIRGSIRSFKSESGESDLWSLPGKEVSTEVALLVPFWRVLGERVRRRIGG